MLRRLIVIAVALLTLAAPAIGDAPAARQAKLQTLRTIAHPVQWHWRYRTGDGHNWQDPAFDDSAWSIKDADSIKWGNERVTWFRTTLTVPETVAGVSVKGSRITFRCGCDDDGIIYINGREAQNFHWDGGSIVLSESAVPGEKIAIAVKGINIRGKGALLFSNVEYSGIGDLKLAADGFLSGYDYARDLFKSARLDGSSPYRSRVDAAVDQVTLAGLGSGGNTAILASLKTGDTELRRIASEVSSPFTINLVGHAHIDFAFLWPWTETQSVVKNTFSTLSNLMDDYPFVFSQSQGALYEETKTNHPDLYAKIREKVKNGQWDVSNATAWCEGDTNMSSGEAIVRSILQAKRFIKQEFGIEPTVGWEPDTFGHAWTLPQILAKSGIKYYYFMRGPGKPLFWWQSPDGSKVLAYQYGGYDLGVDEQGMGSAAVDFCTRSGVNDYMRPFGVGDHGGGPTKAMLRTAMDLRSRSDYPKVEFVSAAGYFDKAAKSAKNLPVIDGELNPVFAGCYTSQSDTKRYYRECENSLLSSEVVASIASAYGLAYPADDFKASWRKTAFNQFHDILSGTAIHAGYEYPKQLHDEVVAQAKSASDASVNALAAQIDTRGQGVPIVVYNPLAWTRTDSVTVTSPFAGQATAVKVIDGAGHVYAGRSLGNRLTFTARDVPAMGYKVFWVSRISKPFGSNVAANGSVVENQFFRVRVDPKSGVITGIYDKLNRRNVLAPGQYTDLLQILSENSKKMSAWKIGQIMGTKSLLDSSEVIRIDTGPAKVTLQYDHRYGQSIFTQELTLYDAVPRIDIRMAADWRQPWVKDKTTPMLKVAFTADLTNPKATFEIPFGSIQRAKDGNEVVGQKWADLSDADYGVSILNDCKYGFDAAGKTLRMSLVRSPQRPDPHADQGMHEMAFSIYPHKGDWRTGGTVRKGYDLNEPLIAVVDRAHEGSLPSSKSFVSVSAPNLVVTALKKAEDDDSFIVRLYETNGKACQSVIYTGLPARSYVETDLMENPVGTMHPITDGQFRIEAGKYEIKTYKLIKN